jgi:hypothetical protein
MKLVRAPVKVISRPVEYMIARSKLMIERHELSMGPRQYRSELTMLLRRPRRSWLEPRELSLRREQDP